MDPLTHTLTGAVLADTGMARRTRLEATTLIVAALLPDVDALANLLGADTALALRRGYTHGVLAIVLLPILLAGAVVLLERSWPWLRASAPGASFARLLPLAYLGVASHLLLDWLNTYGIRLLMPFDDRWFYGDTLFIIDPWLWLLLGGALFLRHSSSRRSLLAWGALASVTTAILIAGSAGSPVARAVWLLGLLILTTLRAFRGKEPTVQHGRLAIATLVAASLYVATLHAGSRAARRAISAQLEANNVNVEDMMVGPLPLRPLRHTVVIDTGKRYRFGTYDWFREPRLLLDRRHLNEPAWTRVVAAALRAPCLQGMVGWVRFPWVEIQSTQDGGHVVHLLDARYTRTRTSGFGGASVRLDADLSDACDAPPD